jgi:hypothetical protein
VQRHFLIAMAPRGCQLVAMETGCRSERSHYPARRGRCGASSIKRLCLALALSAPLLGATPAPAQRGGALPAGIVDQLTARARGALPMARLEDGSSLPPESEAERARPIVPRALEIQTIERGMLTGRMEACGLDWRNDSYLPYVRALRRRYRGKPMAYLGLLHGITQAMTTNALAAQGGACTDDMRAALTADAASRAVDVP